jgi:hypothetical protein
MIKGRAINFYNKFNGILLNNLKKMKYTLAIAALFATSNAIKVEGDYFKPGFSGTIGASAYDREPRVPANYVSDDDDIFMRSMVENYALEAKTEEDKATGYKGGEPTGKFWMDEFAAKAAAQEVLCTHKAICGADLTTYLDTYFSKAWGHFDVNRTGYIEVIKMPQFIRFLASDQYFQFIQPK